MVVRITHILLRLAVETAADGRRQGLPVPVVDRRFELVDRLWAASMRERGITDEELAA